MSEITTFARKELEHEVWSKQDYAEYYQLMHTLITTIESQKEEIVKLSKRLKSEELSNKQQIVAYSSLEMKNNLLHQQISTFQAWQPNSWDAHLQIESLKAIKELAEKRGDTLEHLVKSEAHHKWKAEDKVEDLQIENDRLRLALDKIFHESPFPSSAIDIARQALQIERLQNE